MLKCFRFFLIVLLCLGLTACGFQLRGEKPLPPGLRTLYVDASPYAPFTLQLKQSLKSAGIDIVNSSKASPVTLQILKEDFDQHSQNISANTLVQTYVLTYTIHFQLVTKDKKVLYGPTTVSTQSNYVVSDNQILGDDSQLGVEKNNMRRELVGLLFNRLESGNVRQALSKI